MYAYVMFNSPSGKDIGWFIKFSAALEGMEITKHVLLGRSEMCLAYHQQTAAVLIQPVAKFYTSN